MCRMIDEKDKVLFLDLMQVRDKLDQSKIGKDGFNASAEVSSQILLDDVFIAQLELLKQ